MTQPGHRYSAIPSFKIDHNIDAKDKFSFYYRRTQPQNQINTTLGQRGWPADRDQRRSRHLHSELHGPAELRPHPDADPAAAPRRGLHQQHFQRRRGGSIRINSSTRLDIRAHRLCQSQRNFPQLQRACYDTLTTAACRTLGPPAQIQNLTYEEKPTFNANVTWVHGKHTYKLGAEVDLFKEVSPSTTAEAVSLATGTGATSEPFTHVNSLQRLHPRLRLRQFPAGRL